MFQDETRYPDNRPRSNFVFLGYPYTPAIAADDYKRVIKEIETEFGIRMWYFLDEITTSEMMRKVWRAILRSDFCIFDISDGNPNVAFELGLAVSQFKKCMTLLKTGTKNPLGSADLGYSERSEYTSAETLKERIKTILTSKSTYLKLVRETSYQIYDSNAPQTRTEIEEFIRSIVEDDLSEQERDQGRGNQAVRRQSQNGRRHPEQPESTGRGRDLRGQARSPLGVPRQLGVPRPRGRGPGLTPRSS
jgi:hypothetical protein